MKLVATVKAITLYPVKSMKGLSVEKATLNWYGFTGDRRYGFVQDKEFGHFPWLTARELPQLIQYQATFLDESDLATSPIQILTNDGERFKVTDGALVAKLSAEWGKSIHLMQLNRGVFDAAPVSVMTTATANQLEVEYAKQLDIRRFRQNIILEAVDPAAPPYIEDSWSNQTLCFGEGEYRSEISFQRPISRCQIINIDPETAERDSDVLKAVNRSRDRHVGMYAWPRKLGEVTVGQKVYLLD